MCTPCVRGKQFTDYRLTAASRSRARDGVHGQTLAGATVGLRGGAVALSSAGAGPLAT